MTRAPDLTAINCTSCGAGLDVLGGGRVIVHICPYCGTELDAQDNYKTLRRFTEVDRPDSVFAIGMRATLFGVEFTIIGVLGHEEQWAGQTYRWLDHQLYSPTHGYAWLTEEDGHYTFTRRHRYRGWMSARRVETEDIPPTVTSRGERYTYYETTTSKVVFAQGEFTWAPQIGEATTAISAMSDTAMLSFAQDGEEAVTHRTVYLPKEVVEERFGLTLPKPQGVHPLQPFIKGPNTDFLRATAAVFAALAICLGAAFSVIPGTPALRTTQFTPADLPLELPVEITGQGGLTRIDLASDAYNSWAYMDITVYDPDDVPLFEAGRTLERYAGDQDGQWSEGNGHGSLRFYTTTPGTHTLSIEMSETGIWRGGYTPRDISRMTVSVTSGLSSGFWLFVAAGGFLALTVLVGAQGLLHNWRRWRGSDWSDED